MVKARDLIRAEESMVKARDLITLISLLLFFALLHPKCSNKGKYVIKR